MNIAIDFDGTCVTHEFPKIGKDIGAVPILKKLVENGHNLILWTMRSDVVNPKSNDIGIVPKGGQYLSDAVRWFNDNGIKLWAIQCNPEQSSWTHSPKAYAQLYIDDAALGCPLHFDKSLSDRPFVNWHKVEVWLTDCGYLK